MSYPWKLYRDVLEMYPSMERSLAGSPEGVGSFSEINAYFIAIDGIRSYPKSKSESKSPSNRGYGNK
jgi:hypothetical protein